MISGAGAGCLGDFWVTRHDGLVGVCELLIKGVWMLVDWIVAVSDVIGSWWCFFFFFFNLWAVRFGNRAATADYFHCWLLSQLNDQLFGLWNVRKWWKKKSLERWKVFFCPQAKDIQLIFIPEWKKTTKYSKLRSWNPLFFLKNDSNQLMSD